MKTIEQACGKNPDLVPFRYPKKYNELILLFPRIDILIERPERQPFIFLLHVSEMILHVAHFHPSHCIKGIINFIQISG